MGGKFIYLLISTNDIKVGWSKTSGVQNSHYPECRKNYAWNYDPSLPQGGENRRRCGKVLIQ